MSAVHRAPKPPLRVRLAGWIERVTGRGYDLRMDFDARPIEPRTVVVDHLHALDEDGHCRRSRCGFDATQHPDRFRDQRVIRADGGAS